MQILEIENRTPFATGVVLLADENGQPFVVVLVKATYRIAGDMLILADSQMAISGGGEFWGDPAVSSYKYEPETAFIKLATDVILIGSAVPDKAGATEIGVGFKVGPVQKVARVIGDRFWIRSGGRLVVTKPEPIDRIPLRWERAYGGWDRTNPDAARHSFEPANPVGRGFHGKGGAVEEGMPLPNLEDPRDPIRSISDRPTPVGFGFVAPHWEPRSKLGGTYDRAWSKERKPLLPRDFDRRFFNAAPSGLVSSGYLVGDERVVVANATPGGRLDFPLPAVGPLHCRLVRKNKADEILLPPLDTVIVNSDEMLAVLIWRTNSMLRNGPQEIETILVSLGESADE